MHRPPPFTKRAQADSKSLGAAGMSEDCLTLSVFAPPVTGGGAKNASAGDAELAPTFVWIYGGSFISGGEDYQLPIPFSGSMYDGSALAALGMCVVVPNYRMGVLGFFAHAGLGNVSNVGFGDQQAALRWVSCRGGTSCPAEAHQNPP